MITRVGSRKEEDEEDNQPFEDPEAGYIDNFEEFAEELQAALARCGVDQSNFYYNILQLKKEASLNLLESTGATDRTGKPAGFRRVD